MGETRRQRRDARRALGDTGAEPQPAGAAPDGMAAVPTTTGHEGRRFGFVRESVAELKKVDWPNRAQTIQGTIVVLIACAIVGAYLWGLDQVIRPFVDDVLLG